VRTTTQLLAAALAAWAAGIAGAAGEGAPAPADALPGAREGWRIEVVATAPALKHPSVVCCAPDGRVFVAEDPMDISLPRADLAEGRILTIGTDGRIGVFAQGLHAVFGMQYVEGKLYVLHNPKFSVFAAGGAVAGDRTDLIEATNPEPWALDWNDHVPANFRLAMDGSFYIAVGDKGLYGAVGRDGRRLDLRGGGVVRMWPDGTGLEVHSTGVRNILDVALDAEDEVFTYDNTDEQLWMSRLTHMVEGGFYGYPYDFIPRRPYTLWMMADYGGGAATGAFAYNEDALPPEYHGNLFLADFGRREVMRVVAERDGATWKAVRHEQLLLDSPEGFRPVGIALAPDGLGIYVCDWNHADSKNQGAVVGRLLKLTYTGASQAAPRPAWYLPAALGHPSSAPAAELVEALSHPAASVRLTASRRLAERGKDVVPALGTLLRDQRAPPRARWHAIWTLDAVDGGKAGRDAILGAARDADPSVRRQAVRQLARRRVEEASGLLVGLLADAEPSVRLQAAVALGRIGAPAAAPLLAERLNDEDFFTRFAVFTALNRVGRASPSAWEEATRALESSSAGIREGALFALRATHDEALVGSLVRLARDPSRRIEGRRAALSILAGICLQEPPWKGQWWAYHPVNSPPPEKNVEWPGTAAVREAVLAALGDADESVRLAAVDAAGEARLRAAAPELSRMLAAAVTAGEKRRIVAALGRLREPQAAPSIARVLEAREEEEGGLLQVEAIAALEEIGTPEAAASLVRLIRAAPPKRVLLRAIAGLAHLRPPGGLAVLEPLLRHPDPEVCGAAIAAAPRAGGPDAVTALLDLASESSVPTRRDAAIALTAVPDARALDVYLEGLASRDVLLRDACRQAIAAIRSQALPLIEMRIASLSQGAILQLQGIFRNDAAARSSPLFAVKVERPGPEAFLDALRGLRGDPARGRSIFFDAEGPACSRCHKVGEEGGEVGPDLTSIGSQMEAMRLAESVLFPSRALREGYQQVQVVTKEGRVVAGLMRSESEDTLTLRSAEGKDEVVSRAEIETRRRSDVSLMPEGLEATLGFEEFADLVAFLSSLRGRFEGPAARVR
jgi:putative membrane-bound dehydrogenase-like protein